MKIEFLIQSENSEETQAELESYVKVINACVNVEAVWIKKKKRGINYSIDPSIVEIIMQVAQGTIAATVLRGLFRVYVERLKNSRVKMKTPDFELEAPASKIQELYNKALKASKKQQKSKSKKLHKGRKS